MAQVEVNGMILEFNEKLLLKQEVRIGDTVQLMIDEGYSKPSLYTGVITQILPFDKECPVVEVLYIETAYSSFEIKKKLVTNKTDDKTKIIKVDNDFLPFTKERAIDMLNKNIEDARNKLREAEEKKAYFEKYYNKYFNEISESEEQ